MKKPLALIPICIWQILITILFFSFMACLSTKTSDCGIHEFPSEENIAFSENLWQKDFFNIDSFNTSEFYANSRPVLRAREKMLCSLITILEENKFTYDDVISKLGNTFHAPTDYTPYCNPADKTFDCKEYFYYGNMKEKAKAKEILVYDAGSNASGDCFIVLVFSEGRYAHSFRLFTY